MKRRFVDLSIYLENDVVSDPAPFGLKITYMNHETSVPQMLQFFPGLGKEYLPASVPSPSTRCRSSGASSRA